jgi:hypothetical protein
VQQLGSAEFVVTSPLVWRWGHERLDGNTIQDGDIACV